MIEHCPLKVRTDIKGELNTTQFKSVFFVCLSEVTTAVATKTTVVASWRANYIGKFEYNLKGC